jgi:hypothetical protein
MDNLTEQQKEDIARIIRAVADEPSSPDDSSCAFCSAYGHDPNDKMPFLENEECVVLTAKRLIKELNISE